MPPASSPSLPTCRQPPPRFGSRVAQEIRAQRLRWRQWWQGRRCSFLPMPATILGPALQFLTNACVVLFMIQSADRLILCLGCFWIKLRGIKPVVNTTAASGKGSDDVEAGAQEEDFPMVHVQIPMCNEKEVYQQSIGAVCNLDWPRSNFLVQVLDDSDDAATSALIKEEVEKWQQEGVRILLVYQQSIGAVCNLDWPRSNFLVQVLDDSDDAATSALIKEEVEKWQREGVRILLVGAWCESKLIQCYRFMSLRISSDDSQVRPYQFDVAR